ncbi:serine O-acetyltransferase [Pseudohongiella sp. SYSU M77423]|uniref:serine O-acetyltransferase n=1 Tax=unclassified Pseudohongiella TaxID=2629611 RepID=UPI001F01E6E3|nr:MULTISPECIES: serine O-acetyltransferase [unclassified Pseudohongiella]MDH7944775.1 serine O-acetyltransferase [Pseudohongiella sp. SYSU M77423]MEC8860001.1 serine O-acetyltransferase [Pseudomonadota bacterium]
MSDTIWNELQAEARELIAREPLLASYVYACVLNHNSLSSSLSYLLAHKLANYVMSAVAIRELFDRAFADNPQIVDSAAVDIKAVYERDAATSAYLPVILYLKGYQSIQVHRVAHHLWKSGRKDLALYLQSRNSEVFGVDIHPACIIGKGIMFDHATGIVIGETTVIEDDVSIMQSVTLGGTGNEKGDRHPKIRSGVLISAGAKVLGNIEIGRSAKVGAGSVVLKDVPPHTTVVGVPAHHIGKPCPDNPSHTMNQLVESE